MGLSQDEARALYEDELARIERVIRFTSRRNGLSVDEEEELRGEVHLRLLADDCAILRALEDLEALPAFLVVTVQRLMLDFRTQRWGKWRPSAAARRAGTVAIRLETLVVRDRIDFDQACEMLRRNEGVETSRDELYALLLTFPRRYGLAAQREVALEGIEPQAGSEPPEGRMAEHRHAATEELIESCLEQGAASLSDEDRLVLRMVFVDGLSVATVSRALQLEQKPLYRRIERLLRELRRWLEAEGVGAETFRELVESRRGIQSLDIDGIFETPRRSSPGRGGQPLQEPSS